MASRVTGCYSYSCTCVRIAFNESVQLLIDPDMLVKKIVSFSVSAEMYIP